VIDRFELVLCEADRNKAFGCHSFGHGKFSRQARQARGIRK
jgi:hypothetical protein